MDCGIPFCHQGCPLGNLIPEWNDLVRRGEWQLALDRLHATNNFPEFTGLICPAPCEAACVLAINDDPGDDQVASSGGSSSAGSAKGWVGAEAAARRAPAGRSAWSARGPAGLAVAEELNAPGHRVVVYERDEGPGGLIRLGVPDFKLEKWIIDRRVRAARGGRDRVRVRRRRRPDLAIDELNARHDAVVLALGSRIEREIALPGRELRRHPHRDDLPAAAQPRRRRRRRAGAHRGGQARDRDRRRRHRRGLRGLRPPRAGARRSRSSTSTRRRRARSTASWRTWPDFPKRLWSTYALDEGGERYSSFNATAFDGGDGHVRALVGDQVGRAAGLRADGRDARAARRPRADRDRLHRRRARARRPARRRRRRARRDRLDRRS